MFFRSVHFVPAHRSEFLDKSTGLTADAIVIDLEDAVPLSNKREAALALLEFMAKNPPVSGTRHFIRVNGIESPILDLERQILATHPELGVVLPKIQGYDDLLVRQRHLEFRKIPPCIVLIEDPVGLESIGEILKRSRPAGVGIGLEDFLACSIFPGDHLKLLRNTIRTTIALAAMGAGIPCIDTVSMDLKGGGAFLEDCLEARSCGLTAKFTIHPAQISPCNEVFGLDDEAVRAAREIAGSFCGQVPTGYIKWNGRILSPPKVAKALYTVSKIDEVFP